MPKLIKSEEAFSAGPNGKHFKVQRRTFREDGGSEREQLVWIRGQFVVVICRTKDGKFVVIRQFKYGVNRAIWTFPAGGVKEHEDAIGAGYRELQEEACYRSGEWWELAKSDPDLPDKSTGTHTYLLCLRAEPQTFRPSESVLEVKTVTEEELLEMIRKGEFCGQPAKTALLHYLIDKERYPKD